MILMQGNTRLLDSPAIETSTSSTTRVTSIYGITNYNQLTNKVITIVSGATGTNAATTLNINNLGAKSIRQLSSGSLVDPEANWTVSNMVYQVMYNGNVFILLNQKSSGGSQTEVPIFDIPIEVDELTDSSTQAQITTAFGGTTALTNFLIAMESNYILKMVSHDATSPFILNEYSATSSSVILEYIRLETLTNVKLSFTRSNNDLTALVRTETQIDYLTSIPEEVEDLTSSSTSADIIAAYGGADSLEAIVNTISSGLCVIVIRSGGLKQYKIIGSNTLYYSSSHWTLIYYIIDDDKYISTYSLTYENNGYSFSKSNSKIITDTTFANYIYTYSDTSNTILNDILSQLKIWKYGDETEYPPVTPTEVQLTAFMEGTVSGTARKTRIGQLVTDGTILKFNNILSGADRKSRYNKFVYVNKSYSAMAANDYQYDFNSLAGGTTEFYIYWNNTDQKWYWNATGGGGVACFAEGTKVATSEVDTKNIEDLSIGDIILTRNEQGENEYTEITNIISHDETEIYEVQTKNNKILVTGDHELKTDLGKTKIIELDPDLELYDIYDRPIYIDSISFTTLDKPIKVYDIATKNGTYFVGNSNILAYTEEITMTKED